MVDVTNLKFRLNLFSKINLIAAKTLRTGSMWVQNMWGHTDLQTFSVRILLLPSFFGMV